MIVRKIIPNDNKNLALLIRDVLMEHGVARPGTVFTDPTTDNLYELFRKAGSEYFVAEINGEIIGGCGIFPTSGLPNETVELVKLYVHKSHRKLGVGKQLMLYSIDFAHQYGYKSVYLETMKELSKAIALYKSLGFKSIENQLGNSGHFACEIRMIKELE